VELILEKPYQLELFVTIAWFLWSRRNKLRPKEEALLLNRVVFEAKRFLNPDTPPATGQQVTKATNTCKRS